VLIQGNMFRSDTFNKSQTVYSSDIYNISLALIFENGAIYIFKTKKFFKYKNRLFGKISIYYMKKNNSIVIDDMDDVKLVEKIFRI